MSPFVLACIVLAVAAIAASWFLIPRLVEVYARFLGTPFVVCPETLQPVAVEVDAMHAALSTLAGGGRPHLRLSNCSRWPDKQDCGQECVAQIAASPDSCITAFMVRQWYEGAACFLCGRALGEWKLFEPHPVALSPAGITVPWNNIALERLPEALATHRPVCWHCHVVETSQRERGEESAHRPTHIRRIA